MKNIVRTAKSTVLVMAAALLTTAAAANANDSKTCYDAAAKKQWSRAVPSCTAAAERGDAGAQYNLGVMYIEGIGVAISNVQAFGWFSLAAAQGIAESQHNLGTMHDNGLGVEQDYVQAVRWYRQAAVQGLADAQFNLDVMYRSGEGVAQDTMRAHIWLILVAISGRASSVEFRDFPASKMTREQIAQAQNIDGQVGGTCITARFQY